MTKPPAGFAAQAAELLRAAEAAAEEGAGEWTIIIEPGEQVRLISECDRPLSSLHADNPSASVFRVTRGYGRIAVEGREGTRTCRLETTCKTATPRVSGACAAPEMSGDGDISPPPAPRWCTADEPQWTSGLDRFITQEERRVEISRLPPEAWD